MKKPQTVTVTGGLSQAETALTDLAAGLAAGFADFLVAMLLAPFDYFNMLILYQITVLPSMGNRSETA